MSIRIQPQEFDIAKEQEALLKGRYDIGAIVSFTGFVRDFSHNQKLKMMRLEHYPGMAENMLAQIEIEAQKRWPLQGITLIHRYGDLAPGDMIVLVLTASAHREAAFEAAQFIMDQLKTNIPFWKKEYSAENDSAQWVLATEKDKKHAEKW